jgi:hypothetical protein
MLISLSPKLVPIENINIVDCAIGSIEQRLVTFVKFSYLNLVPRLQMIVAKFLLSLHAFMVCRGTTLPLTYDFKPCSIAVCVI